MHSTSNLDSLELIVLLSQQMSGLLKSRSRTRGWSLLPSAAEARTGSCLSGASSRQQPWGSLCCLSLWSNKQLSICSWLFFHSSRSFHLLIQRANLHLWRWHLGTSFSGGPGSVGTHDCKSLFQTKLLYCTICYLLDLSFVADGLAANWNPMVCLFAYTDRMHNSWFFY